MNDERGWNEGRANEMVNIHDARERPSNEWAETYVQDERTRRTHETNERDERTKRTNETNERDERTNKTNERDGNSYESSLFCHFCRSEASSLNNTMCNPKLKDVGTFIKY